MLDEGKREAERMELHTSSHGKSPRSRHPRTGFVQPWLNVTCTALPVILQPEGILEPWMVEYCEFQKFLCSTLLLWPDTPLSWIDRRPHLLVSFLPWNHDRIHTGQWSCQDKSDALAAESLVTEFNLKVSVILGIPEVFFSLLGLGRSFPSRGRRCVAQGLLCFCSHVGVMGFWQLFSGVFSFLFISLLVW